MPGFDVSGTVRGLGVIRSSLRLLRDDAADVAATVERASTAAAAAVDENRGRFQELAGQAAAVEAGFGAIRQHVEGISSLAGEAVLTMSARVEEVEGRVVRTREVVSRESSAAEEDTRRVRQALDETARAAEQTATTAKASLAGLLDDIELTDGHFSAMVKNFDVLNEQIPPALRNYITLAEGTFEQIIKIREELNVLRDQVKSGALDVGAIIGRLGELQTVYAQKILEALARVKDGGAAAIRELRKLLSEAERIPDSATGILASGLDALLDDALRNGQLS